MNDTNAILHALREHREETRQDMHELRQAVVKIADAAADMGKTMARSEERHGKHEEVIKRIGRTLDDHETRIRSVESDRPDKDDWKDHDRQIRELKAQIIKSKGAVSGGWKTLTVIGSLILGAAAIISLIARLQVLS